MSNVVPSQSAGRATLFAATVVVPLAVLTFFFAAFKIYDFDIGYHLAKGRYFLENSRLVPATDFLCSDYRGLDFLDRWGFQVVVYFFYALLGVHGLAALRILLVGLSFGVLFFAGTGASVKRLWAWRGLVVILALLVCYERFSLRGELIYYFFTLAYVITLMHFIRGSNRFGIVVLPVHQVLWANLHGTFIFGVAIIGLFLLGEALEELRYRVAAALRRRALRKTGAQAGGSDSRAAAGVGSGRPRSTSALTAVFIISLLACFVNPRGLAGFLLPIQMFIRLSLVPWYHEAVAELAPTFGRYEQFGAMAIPALIILMILAGMFFLLNIRRVRLSEALVLAFALFLTLMGRRNIAFFGLVGSLFLIRDGEAVLGALRERLQARGALRVLAATSVCCRVVICLLAAFVCFELASDRFSVRERSLREFGFGVSEVAYPAGAVRFMEDRGIGGKVFTNWDAGSYLLWQSFPRAKPYIDSEGDCSLELLVTYRKIMSGAAPFSPEVDRLGIDTVLLRHRSEDTKPLIGRLWQDFNWSLVYWDDVAVVFLRNERRLALEIPVIAHADANAAFKARLEEIARADAVVEGGGSGLGGLLTDYFSTGETFRKAQKHLYLAGLMDVFGFSDLERDELLRALGLFSDFPEALNNLGASRAQAGDTAEAKKMFRKALDIEPAYVSAIRNLGAAFMQERNYSSAIEEYRRGLEINPRDAVLPNLLAKAHLGRSSAGDVEKAISVIREALERDPDNIGAHELLADIHTHFTNDLQQAAHHREEARRAREAAYHLPPLPE